VTAYLLRRLFAVIPVMFVVVTVIFLLIHLIPGDPVAVMLGPDATPRQIAQVRSTYGLDLPLHLQLLIWYGRVLQGDLGESYFLGRTVLQAMLERLEPTMVLTVLALFVAVIIGIPAGVIAAAHPHSPWDRLLMAVALLGVCIPSFWLALNFIYLFAVQLKWLPAMGYIPLSQGLGRTLRYMLLPAVSLGFNQSALIARIARSCMLEVMRQDYIRTARAKGLAERVVIYIHALRNAMIPTVTVIGITFAILIGGAVVTEVVFNIPGLGRLIISAILRRDYPVVQGCVLFLTMTYVLINLCVDVIYVFIDPRIKYD
jgi:peptide/nickel transport system permease protein